MKNKTIWFFYFIFCFFIYLLTNKKSTVDFVIDKFEYHAMGVNLAYGHGIQKVGMLEQYAKYNFTISDIPDNEALINRPILVHFFTKISNRFHFFREPMYSVFLGGIYSIFGVSPKAVYIVQLLMLLTSAFLIYDLSKLFSQNHWSSYIGFVVGFFFIYTFKNLPFEILPETYFLFLFTWLIWVFVKFKDTTGLIKIFSISLLLALIYLGKPYIVFFIPLLFIKSILNFVHNKKWKEDIWIVICFFLFVTPYNIYSNLLDRKQVVSEKQFNELVFADNNNIYQKENVHFKEYLDLNPVVNYELIDDTSKIFFHFFEQSYVTNKLFFITKRPGGILLDTHNGNLLTDGDFFNWRINDNHYYNSPKVKDKPDLLKIIYFYNDNPNYIFPILFLKIYAAFFKIPFFWIIGILIVFVTKPFNQFFNIFINGGFLLIAILGLINYNLDMFIFHMSISLFSLLNIYIVTIQLTKINYHVAITWISFLLLFIIIVGWVRFSVFTNIFYIVILFNLFKSEMHNGVISGVKSKLKSDVFRRF